MGLKIKDMETKFEQNFKQESIFKQECLHSQYNRSSRLSEVMQTGFVYTSHFLHWFADGFENIYHLEIIVPEPTGSCLNCTVCSFSNKGIFERLITA